MTGRPTTGMRGRSSGGAQNRSLERGIEILRAFRQGVDHLGNSELAERTGLAKATVSRLTQTLVAGGLLQHDSSLRAYRLSPVILALAHAMRLGSPLLQIAQPMIVAAADKHRANVGLSAPDRDTMIYLEAVRTNRKASLRNVLPGQRVPIELTSMGRAYLAALKPEPRARVMESLRAARRANWARLEAEIEAAVLSVERRGYCAAAWQPGVAAVSAPLVTPDGGIYALNFSVATAQPLQHAVRQLRGPLLDLRRDILEALWERNDAGLN